MRRQFVASRAASGRANLIHVIGRSGRTLCGRPLTGWSRQYLSADQARPLLNVMLCHSCKRKVGGSR